jgi:hypothetical protein
MRYSGSVTRRVKAFPLLYVLTYLLLFGVEMTLIGCVWLRVKRGWDELILPNI